MRKQQRTEHGRLKGHSWRSIWRQVLFTVSVLSLLVVLDTLRSAGPDQLRARAESAVKQRNWTQAAALWHQLNATSKATAESLLSESQAYLAQDLARQAEECLRKTVNIDPSDTKAWLLLLKILRVENRLVEILRLGGKGLEQVAADKRSLILRELTLATLTDVPDDLARSTLKKWMDADAIDIDAHVAYLRRLGTEPRAGDPDRETRLAELSKLLNHYPRHVEVREALLTALADAGEAASGRTLLASWPVDHRDGRFWRLQGRWDLEYNHLPEQAVKALRTAIIDLPQDWRTRYRLARALKVLGHTEDARQEAERVKRLRELLDPLFLEPRLEASFAHLEQPAAREALAELCTQAGLTRLADAWRATKGIQPGKSL
jgi:tetratricopeptide (TPR) repeat protein